MIVYHRPHHAAAIVRDGFRDGVYEMPTVAALVRTSLYAVTMKISAPRPITSNPAGISTNGLCGWGRS
jgi:hypothetical protein